MAHGIDHVRSVGYRNKENNIICKLFRIISVFQARYEFRRIVSPFEACLTSSIFILTYHLQWLLGDITRYVQTQYTKKRNTIYFMFVSTSKTYLIVLH